MHTETNPLQTSEQALEPTHIRIDRDGSAIPEDTRLHQGATVVFQSAIEAHVEFRDAVLFGLKGFDVAPRRPQQLQANEHAPKKVYYFSVYIQTEPPILVAGNPCIIVDGGPE